jgi:hypothetical protein
MKGGRGRGRRGQEREKTQRRGARNLEDELFMQYPLPLQILRPQLLVLARVVLRYVCILVSCVNCGQCVSYPDRSCMCMGVCVFLGGGVVGGCV